ncbi:hypothetical protein CC78DRAFT_281617 [Lojkania enalia]|uniref:Uncharacterized protein n=1 Tax=Lojkania enalia TaxID=147567 RepID=A0A9P4NA84_9PLEO|nr:hypothetical protein CC78DRAFT_281617 [Didymosphaeria enalia]
MLTLSSCRFLASIILQEYIFATAFVFTVRRSFLSNNWLYHSYIIHQRIQVRTHRLV